MPSVDAIRQIRLRFGYAVAGANAAGALVVFGLLVVVLPKPVGLTHTPRTILINAGVFVAFGVIATPLAWSWSHRLWTRTLEWALSGRSPSDDERDLTLRFPLVQQWIVAAVWASAALLFAAINLPASNELAGNVAIGIVLGGLVTCALGFYISERLFRPVAALALAEAYPREPTLPGVTARAVLTWTLGTGTVLLALALIGLGGLSERRFTSERLSIAILVLSVTGIAVGLTTIIGLARSVADPLRSLRSAVGGVEAGDLEQAVVVNDGSEIGLLQAGFNRMVAGLREREQLRDLFGRQVGEDVVRHALEHGVTLGGEAREAAVLFVDLQGSTTIAETRDPSEVVAMLNAFFAVVVDVVATHGGWVNKFEGDAALCVFGAPLPDPDAATNALAAARVLNARLRVELEQMSAGIGVSAGRVVAGNIGAAQRFEYTVIGDPVNEAARLTELAKATPQRVLASGAVLSRASEAECGRWARGEPVTLRGRAAPTDTASPR